VWLVKRHVGPYMLPFCTITVRGVRKHKGEKGRGEIGGVYLPSQLECTQQLIARDGR
jgi:hypothetical protein